MRSETALHDEATDEMHWKNKRALADVGNVIVGAKNGPGPPLVLIIQPRIPNRVTVINPNETWRNRLRRLTSTKRIIGKYIVQ